MEFLRVKKIVCFINKNSEKVIETIRENMNRSYEIVSATLEDIFLLNNVSKEDSIVVVTDDDRINKCDNLAVIGIEGENRLHGLDYIVTDPKAIDSSYIELVYARKNNLPQIIAVTKRLIIREITTEDVEKLLGMYNRLSSVYLEELKDYKSELEFTRAYIDNMYKFYGYGMWIVEEIFTHTIIGRIGLEHRIIENETFVELGYVIDKDYQKMGYGYEGAAAVIEIAKELEIDKLIICVEEKNIPSIKLATKLGFKLWKELVVSNKSALIYELFVL